MTQHQAIVEFAKILLEHVRLDGCERNRKNATELMRLLAIEVVKGDGQSDG
jgi:hypothetical protein